MFRVLPAPPAAADAAAASHVPPVSVLVPPAPVGDLLIVAAMRYDWRTRGRPHPACAIGGGVAPLL